MGRSRRRVARQSRREGACWIDRADGGERAAASEGGEQRRHGSIAQALRRIEVTQQHDGHIRFEDELEALQPAPDQPLDAPIPPEAPQPAPNQNTDELSVAPDASDAPNLAPNAPDAPQTSTANPETEKRAGKRAAEPVTEMPVSKRSKPKRGESSSAPMK